MPPQTTRAVVLEGEELVLWRGLGGSIQLWEDRCPHRGMRLSFGFVRGDRLNCLYHGWTYGTDARCLKIPAHPDLVVPPTIRARPLQVAEAGGLILAGTGDAALPPALVPCAAVASLAVAAAATDIELLSSSERPLATVQAVRSRLAGAEALIGWHVVAPQRTMLHATANSPDDVPAILTALREVRATAETRAAA